MRLCEVKVKSGGSQKISAASHDKGWRLAMRGMERGKGSKHAITALM